MLNSGSHALKNDRDAERSKRTLRLDNIKFSELARDYRNFCAVVGLESASRLKLATVSGVFSALTKFDLPVVWRFSPMAGSFIREQ